MGAKRGHGEGSIYKRGDGRWVAVLDLGWREGKRLRRSFYGTTRREAADRLAAALRDHQNGIQSSASARLTVGAYLDQWLVAIKPSVRYQTWRRYEQDVRLHLKPRLGTVALLRLTPQRVQAMYAELLDAGLAPTTVAHTHAALHRALNQAVRWGLIARNVTSLTEPPRIGRTEMKVLEPAHVARLLEAIAGDRFEALFVVAVSTGMRQGELLGLRWSGVDLDGRSLQVTGSLGINEQRELVVSQPKTAKSRRQVLMSQAAVAALRRHRVLQAQERLVAGVLWEDNDLVFATEVGRPLYPSTVYRRLLSILREAGLPKIRFHDLRHTAATLLLGKGIHPKVVSEMLGHSEIGVTLDLYSHVTPTMQLQAADAFDEVLGCQVGCQDTPAGSVSAGKPS